MPTKRVKKRPKPRARSVKRVTAGKRKLTPGDSLKTSLSTFVHWWTQGFEQIVFEIDELARAKGMPLINARLGASPRVDVSIAHRNAIDALRQLERAGVANLRQEVPQELLWPVTGSFGGRIQDQDELDRTISRLGQFPDDPGSWQKEVVDRMREIGRLGRLYFDFLESRLRKSKRVGKPHSRKRRK